MAGRKKKSKPNFEIYLDRSLTKKRTLSCIQAMKQATVQNLNITIIIDSDGGNAVDGLKFYDFIKREGIKFDAIVQGEACSAAVMILLAAKHRAMTKHSVIMVHRPTFSYEFDEADADHFRGYCDEFSMTEEMYVEIMAQCTGQSKKRVRNDLFLNRRFNAEAALAYGLIDKIV